ncbi:armadillo-type protein [Chytriomyces sp. MP71]|nr:armadillo-type protein [Chytriomyces sp. MP71]
MSEDTKQLEHLLQRIRAQASSGIPAQRKAALLLIAIDKTVQEQANANDANGPHPPLAYFGALITLLEQQLVSTSSVKNEDDDMGEGEVMDESYADREEIVTAIIHLLAIVFSKISTQILRLKFNVLSQTLHSTLQSFASSSAITRDALACLESLLLAMDLATWQQSTSAMVGRPAVLKGLTTSVLTLTLNERPKVRKRAQDVVRKVLAFPPPPALVHPFMIVAVQYYCEVLESAATAAKSVGAAGAGASKKGKAAVKAATSESEAAVLDVLVFLKGMGPILGGKVGGGDDKVRVAVGQLCSAVLNVGEGAGGNIVLMQWVFQVLAAIVTTQTPKVAPPNISLETSHAVLSKSLSTLRPYLADASLAPLWLGTVEAAFTCTSAVLQRDLASADDAESSEAKRYAGSAYPEFVSSFWKTDFVTLLGSAGAKRVIVEKAVEAYASVMQFGIADFMVESASVRKREGKNVWAEVLGTLLEALKAAVVGVTYRENWGAVLILIETALERVGPTVPSMADPIISTLISIRDAPNYSDDYPFKAELDTALEAGALAMGLERFSLTAPLNIFDVAETETRRPYLLSLFTRAMKRTPIAGVSQFGPSNLVYFEETILPLYQALNERGLGLKTKGLLQPAKLFHTLASQAFSLFPAICSTTPKDLMEAFDTLAPQLATLLQTQSECIEVSEDGIPSETDLRPLVYSGLQALVEGYSAANEYLQSAVTQLESDMDESPALLQARDDLELAGQGLVKLSGNVNKFLSLLCTIYTTPPEWILKTGENKGAVLQSLHDRGQASLEGCIKAFMGIADGKAVTGYFFQLVKNVLQLQTAAKEQETAMDESNEEVVAEIALMRLKVYAMLDLLCVLVVFLPEVKAVMESVEESEDGVREIPSDSPLHLFYRLLSGQLRDPDATLQKKTYKALNLIMAVLPGAQAPYKDLMPKLIDPEVISRTTSGVKRTRMRLIQLVVEAAASSDKKASDAGGEDEEEMLLEFVPVVLSEVMLTTKEASEKARTAAYECLVALGRTMHDIGVRRKRDEEWAATRRRLRGEQDDMDEGEKREVSFKEYMMMVVAGLAGGSSSMQSAAVACCGRLIFEFHDVMGEDLCKEIVSTILLFMASPNREIVKAALGFIKVIIVTLPQEYMEDELENIITSMLTHSRPHKSAFKSKVKNILERLIRKFSYEAIEGFIPETDFKLIRNIRKVRERQLKKRTEAKAAALTATDGDDASDEDNAASKLALKTKKTMQSRQKEFEDALHGSEDEDGDSDDGNDDHYIPEQFRDAIQAKKSQAGSRSMIREDEDVVDFLDSQVISRVTSAKAGALSAGQYTKRKRGSEFNVNEDGRIMIAESDDETTRLKTLSTADEPEDYYKQAITGEGAFKRLPDGRVKFVNKRPRDEEGADAKSDRLGAGASNMGGRWGHKNFDRKKAGLDETTKDKMLGAQYRSKKAKGDVKRANMPDPYAYIPLSGKIVGNKKKATELSKDFKDVIKASVSRKDVQTRGGSSGGPHRGVKKSNKKHK